MMGALGLICRTDWQGLEEYHNGQLWGNYDTFSREGLSTGPLVYWK